MPSQPGPPSPLLASLLAADGAAGATYRLQQCRHGPMLFNRHDMYIGRSLEAYGEYSESEIFVLRQILRPGAVVIEAGANIGAHTIPLARIVEPGGYLFAFEPQRLQFQLLCANLALNGRVNVFARQEALGEQSGTVHVPLLDPEVDHNFGGVSLATQDDGEAVPMTTIDALALGRLDLVKADVEGMELAVLAGGHETIARKRPAIYVECDRRERAPALIGKILGLGYRAWWHLAPMFNPDNFSDHRPDVFPGVVSCNLLALPAERAGAIALQPVAGPEDWPAQIRMTAPVGPPVPPAR